MCSHKLFFEKLRKKIDDCLQCFNSYLRLFVYAYLHLLIYTNVLFILLYELDKIVKIWGM